MSDGRLAICRGIGMKGICVAAAAIVGFALALAVSGAMPDTAHAHCVAGDKNQTLYIRDDRFRNFDYQSDADGDCNIDWPVDFLYYDNAGISKVKNRLGNIGYGDEGGPMHAKLDDSAGWGWDADKGVKNPDNPAEYCASDIEHTRLYAVYNDNFMYNVDWGNYILGTAHIDHQEICGGWSGNSETAENRIADDILGATNIGLGCVRKDDVTFFNHMDYSVADDGHHKENSGGGTRVCVR